MKKLVECKICGIEKRRLMHHIKFTHKMNSEEYKKIYNSPVMCEYDRVKTANHLDLMRKNLWKKDSYIALHKSKYLKEKISTGLKKYFENNPQAKERLSINASQRISSAGNPRFKRGYYFSTKMKTRFYYQSGFELEIMKILDIDSRIIEWHKNSKAYLNYHFNGKKRRYVYDFELILKNGTMLMEAKQFPDKCLMQKLYALDYFCRENNLLFSLCRRLKHLNILFDNFNKYASTNTHGGQGKQVSGMRTVFPS